MKITHGLLIQKHWIEKILSGKKTWEIRGSNTRAWINCIASKRDGSGRGDCKLIDTVGPLALKELQKNRGKIGIIQKEAIRHLPYKKTYAWVIAKAKKLKKPLPYKHPQGAVRWVKLSKYVANKL